MLLEPLISIVLPVYNRHKYLRQAINSVIIQTYQNWELIIADDASDIETKKILDEYTSLSRIKIIHNETNLGLFANVNQAIKQSSSPYIALLCSDDLLLPHCLETSIKLIKSNPNVNLILTAFNMIDGNGIEIPSGSKYYHDQMISSSLQRLNPSKSIPLLLQWGSINGNLTGMFFTRYLFESIGGFKENWSHAADWEWVYRACSKSDILLSKMPIATVRSHDEQLSVVNFKNISNSLEVIEMVKILLNDSYIVGIKRSKKWALQIMQYHLWFAFKFCLQGKYHYALEIIKAINQVTGFNQTLFALIKWLPSRWQIFIGKQNFTLPTD